MSAASAAPRKRVLLAVLAHPDDESFGPGGTLARYAQEGVEVHLICATRGEVGEMPGGRRLTEQELARLREDELRCAARILGLQGVYFLDYRDSGMPGSESNRHPMALAAAPLEEVATQVTEWMLKLQPQVVITFDPYGGYCHPDHVAIHKATAEAFRRLLESGPGGYRPEKLYYHTLPKGWIRLLVRLMPLFGRDPHRFGVNQDIDLVEIASFDVPVHTRIRYRHVARLKHQASACHQSQGGGGASGGWLGLLLRAFSGYETFMRAYPPVQGRVRERDLFQGFA